MVRFGHYGQGAGTGRKELNMIAKLELAGLLPHRLGHRAVLPARGSSSCRGRLGGEQRGLLALSITRGRSGADGLLFERFLSEERGEWPELDLDLPSGEQREKVIQHVYAKYGKHGAAMTANVITYRDRSAAREVSKALGFSLEQADKLSKTVSTWNFGEIREKLETMPAQLAQSGFDPADLRVQHSCAVHADPESAAPPRAHWAAWILAKGTSTKWSR